MGDAAGPSSCLPSSWKAGSPKRHNGPAWLRPRAGLRAAADGRNHAMAATNQAGSRDVAGSQAGPTGDPLPSWREGASKQAILDFVQRVTTEGGDDAVPPQ